MKNKLVSYNNEGITNYSKSLYVYISSKPKKRFKIRRVKHTN